MKKTLGTLLLALTLLTAPGAFAAQPPNTFFAGPCTGPAHTQGFRILCDQDLAGSLNPIFASVKVQPYPTPTLSATAPTTGTLSANTYYYSHVWSDENGRWAKSPDVSCVADGSHACNFALGPTPTSFQNDNFIPYFEYIVRGTSPGSYDHASSAFAPSFSDSSNSSMTTSQWNQINAARWSTHTTLPSGGSIEPDGAYGVIGFWNAEVTQYIVMNDPLGTAKDYLDSSGIGRFTDSAGHRAVIANGTVVAGQMQYVLGSLLGANMNSTADQPITINVASGFTTYVIDKIEVTNASTSLTTAVGGFYPAASKGGTPIVAAAQTYSALSTATKVLNPTIAVTDTRTVTPIYLSLTTPQGATATADVYIVGHVLK